jgi:spore germination cell wall hydrolase CwlJ-like protein
MGEGVLEMSKFGKAIDEDVKQYMKSILKSYFLGVVTGILFMFLILIPNTAHASDENGEILCLAQNIYFESGNQPMVGKIAVSHVVLNRVESNLYPNTICEVIRQGETYINWKGIEVPKKDRCQFSWYCDGLSDEPVDSKTWIESILIARRVMDGEWTDITEGALFYHADYVLPFWANELNRTTTIDNHLFYK